MDRRKFLSLTGTFTGGSLLLPDFLYALGKNSSLATGGQCLVFIQLNGGNDGLNTFVPFDDPLYAELRPKIALSRSEVIGANKGMAFHPALAGLAKIQQDGNLSVLQNVGYPEPVRSHFRSQEIWQTASASNEFLNRGWLGRYLDFQCKEHDPTAGLNIDTIDNLALRGEEPNSITVRDLSRFKSRQDQNTDVVLSGNPHLDFVRKIASSISEGSDDIQKALARAASSDVSFPKTNLGKNLEWISKLIKGNLNSKVYYTSLGGFDTHDNQIPIHRNRLMEVNDAVFSFYTDLKRSGQLENVTTVIFSEFGRRVRDNGRGTDHGTAAPMFIIGGNNQGRVIGSNPDLADLDKGDLKHRIDFRTVYSTLLREKLEFDARKIGISNDGLTGLF